MFFKRFLILLQVHKFNLNTFIHLNFELFILGNCFITEEVFWQFTALHKFLLHSFAFLVIRELCVYHDLTKSLILTFFWMSKKFKKWHVFLHENSKKSLNIFCELHICKNSWARVHAQGTLFSVGLNLGPFLRYQMNSQAYNALETWLRIVLMLKLD